MGPENKILKQGDSHFCVFVCQNWMKNGQVMTMGSACAKVASGLFCAN